MSSSAAASSGTRVEGEDDGENWKKRTVSPASSCGAQTSSASAENSPSAANINLRREYTLAVQTNSYNEMWSIIHHRHGQGDVVGDGEEILRPDRASVEEAIRLARPTRLTRLVSRYLESSEQASDLFLSLRRSVDLAREMYSPIALLLDVLPATSPIPSPSQSVPSLLSLPQCDGAFDAFVDFDRRGNPFQSAADGFVDIRDCFSVLKQQLELRLLTARRRHRLLRRATIASATCLVVSVTGAVAAALVLASHALLAVAAMGPVALCCGGSDVLAGRRRHLRERMSGTDAAARETYVLDKHLSTVERLVARLHATVESDKVLVRLGLERGRGQIHPIQEVVRQLRKNHSSFRHQLTDLDEHVCLCLAALNRARYLLLQQIHRLRSTG
ncbi:hypothetical protein IEQ34_009237 [Dendrobium chrysotoxum]|uniref:Uncharacterized protein n=1 Tax=Dendrobium chrysotoxum TaxID=161865 RepID=A0AAV7H021_DENCH|nr:hypothetical protein IEQ34_009237 [Dendrobium chrysotoxum]